MPEIAVVVPTYNVARYIEKCLDSLVNQNFRDFEVFVIDDGSPADERSLVLPYTQKYPNFHYIRQENGGYGSVLEYAIHQLDFSYFLVCDPDDWLAPSALESLYALALKHDADVVCGSRYLVFSDTDHEHYDKMFNSAYVNLKEGKAYHRQDPDFQAVYMIENAPHAKLFKRNNLIGLRFPKKTTNTDALLFYYALFKSRNVVYTSTPLAYYLIDRFGNSVTEIKPKVVDELIRVHRLILEYAEGFKDIDDAFYFQMFTAFYYICDRCDVIHGEEPIILDKLQETGRLLDLMIPHRYAIKRFYRLTRNYNLDASLKFSLMLNPLLSRTVRGLWFKARLKRRHLKPAFIKRPPEIKISSHPLKVSIVVPVYNVENYLRRCLDSLVHQTLDRFEIIVVNDGSKDGSQAIIDTYVRDYPDLVISLIKANGGLSDARNFAIPYIRSEYVAFIDSDDWVDLTMMEKLYDKAQMTQSDIAVCDMEYVYEDGHLGFSSGGDFLVVDTEENPDIITINNSACNKLYRTELFRDIRFVKGIWYEDLATIPKLISITERLCKVDEPLYKYFQRWNSIVHSENPKVFDIYTALESVNRYLIDAETYPTYRKYIERLIVIHCADLTTIRIKDFKKNRIQYLKENMEKLSGIYPHWYWNPVVWKTSPKKWIVFTLNRLHLFRLLLALFDMRSNP